MSGEASWAGSTISKSSSAATTGAEVTSTTSPSFTVVVSTCVETASGSERTCTSSTEETRELVFTSETSLADDDLTSLMSTDSRRDTERTFCDKANQSRVTDINISFLDSEDTCWGAGVKSPGAVIDVVDVV